MSLKNHKIKIYMNNNKKVKENNKSEEKKRGNITGEWKKKMPLPTPQLALVGLIHGVSLRVNG